MSDLPARADGLARLWRSFRDRVLTRPPSAAMIDGELARERSKIAAILESVEDGLIVLDRERTIVHINEVAGAILDLSGEKLMGAQIDRLAAGRRHVHAL